MIINGKEYTTTELQGSLWYWPDGKNLCIFSRCTPDKWTFLTLTIGSNRMRNPVDEVNIYDIISSYQLQFVGFIGELDPESLLYEKGIIT